ncbi:hypothetical protein ACFL10_00405 [Patescibacteria group bacterium]
MQEQDKQRLLAIIIIAVIIFGALGYFLWSFVLNKGTVSFQGTPPYTINIKGQVYECSLESCDLTILSGEYDYQIGKEGYNSKYSSVTVERGEVTVVDASLEYVPQLLEPTIYSMYNLSTGYSKFADALDNISLFKTYESDYPLKRLPKKVENIVFSPTGEKALVFEEDQVSTYYVSDYTTTKIEGLEGSVNGDFSLDENIFYTVAYDEDSKKDALIKVDFDGQTFENMVFFTRDIDDYELKISPNEKFAILADETNEPTVMYLIDLEAKSRTNVYEGSFVTLGKFNYENSFFVFEARNYEDELPGLKYLNVNEQTIEEFDFKAGLNEFDFAKGPLGYFITDTEFNISGFTLEFVEGSSDILTVEELFAAEETGVQPFSLFKWDPILNEFSHVINLNDLLIDVPVRIEANENGNLLRFLIGDKNYDLVLGE